MFSRNLPILSLVLFSISLVTGCDRSQSVTQDSYDRSQFDQQRVKQGRELFLKHCMVCHGFNAEGGAEWRKRDNDGKYPPPPLNGTGHAWHHSKAVLVDTVRNGTIRIGGNMPAWKDKLTEKEMESIILWFQTLWPEQLYEAWVRTDRETRKN